TGADLVHDLAGLLLARLVELQTLHRGEHAKRERGDIGIEGQYRQSGDDAIAAEQGGEPWYAGHHEGPLGGARDERIQVRLRALQQRIEEFVARRECGPGCLGVCYFRSSRCERTLEINRMPATPVRRLVFVASRAARPKGSGRAGGEFYQERGPPAAQRARSGAERNLCEAP